MSYDAVGNLLELWIETNVVTNMIFSYLFLVAVFVICYVMLQRYDVKNVTVATTFITMLISLLMLVAGIMTNAGFIVCTVLFGVSFFWMLFDK